MTFQAAAFPGKDCFALLDIARDIDLGRGAAHRANENHDSPDIVVRKAKSGHSRSWDAMFDGVVECALAQAEEASITDQGRSTLSFAAIHSMTGGTSLIEKNVACLD